MKTGIELMDAQTVNRVITRIAHEIIEQNKGVKNLALIGIHRRGVPFAKRIAKKIEEVEGIEPNVGSLDITLYRDDLSKLAEQPVLNGTDCKFNVEGMRVVLVDDVLYTGRTVRAALDALMDLGRPSCIQLAVMVDRGHRELPFRADYIGKNVPTSPDEVIHVLFSEIDGEDRVMLSLCKDI